jgi:hypothetical protein
LRKTPDLANFFDLGLNMIESSLPTRFLATDQLRTDVLKIVTDNFRSLGGLAGAGKLTQARFVARGRT